MRVGPDLAGLGKSFLLFAGLSGGGWLLDMLLLWLGVSQLGLPAGVASFMSATVAAMSVYVISRSVVFGSAARLDRSALAYLAYTAANIVVWAIAIQLLADALVAYFGLRTVDAALWAKIAVTPLSLAMNYVASRLLSPRGPQ